MKNPTRAGRSDGKRLCIRTTILELVRAFSEQSKDDGLVVAAVSRLLNSGRVRSARSLVPVKVIAEQTTLPSPYLPANRHQPGKDFGIVLKAVVGAAIFGSVAGSE
jgi:hypothetical protein